MLYCNFFYYASWPALILFKLSVGQPTGVMKLRNTTSLLSFSDYNFQTVLLQDDHNVSYALFMYGTMNGRNNIMSATVSHHVILSLLANVQPS